MPSKEPVQTPIWDKRLVLVTGKGGVGKTIIAAALAQAAHAAGRKVLLGEVASDLHVPSPLLGLFGHPKLRQEEPVEMLPRLYGVRLSPSIGHKLFLRAALKVRILVDTAMKSAALTRFLMAAPTFPEIGVLYQLVAMLREDFDHFIVDLPATGHAIGLTALPRTVVRVVPTGLIGEAISEGLAALTDPARTGAVVVTIPEALPVTESSELIAAFQKYGIHVRAAILNQMPSDPFSAEERGALRDFMASSGKSLLGVRELRRLERAVEARESFRTLIPEAIRKIELPSFAGTDPKQLVQRLGGALIEDAP